MCFFLALSFWGKVKGFNAVAVKRKTIEMAALKDGRKKTLGKLLMKYDLVVKLVVILRRFIKQLMN